MILTGPRIEECLVDGSITIDPLGDGLVGPNSVDLRLHKEMKVYARREPHPYTDDDVWKPPNSRYSLDMRSEFPTRTIVIREEGYVLQPGVLYLARTMEVVGSDKYVPMVEGRSSCGRLGLQVHMTAGFCDTGFKGTITLEMTTVYPLIVYAGEAIAQVFFLRPEGKIRLYQGRYGGQVDATPSRMHERKERTQ